MACARFLLLAVALAEGDGGLTVGVGIEGTEELALLVCSDTVGPGSVRLVLVCSDLLTVVASTAFPAPVSEGWEMGWEMG